MNITNDNINPIMAEREPDRKINVTNANIRRFSKFDLLSWNSKTEKPKTIIIANSFGLKNIPMYLAPESGKMNTKEATKEKTVTIFINLNKWNKNLSPSKKIEIEKIANWVNLDNKYLNESKSPNSKKM